MFAGEMGDLHRITQSTTEDEEPCSGYEGGWTPMRSVSRRSRDAIVGPQRPILGAPRRGRPERMARYPGPGGRQTRGKWHPAMEKNSGNRTMTSDWDETGRARRKAGCDGRDAFGRTMQRSKEGVAKIGQLSEGKATGVEGNWGRAGSVRIGLCRARLEPPPGKELGSIGQYRSLQMPFHQQGRQLRELRGGAVRVGMTAQSSSGDDRSFGSFMQRVELRGCGQIARKSNAPRAFLLPFPSAPSVYIVLAACCNCNCTAPAIPHMWVDEATSQGRCKEKRHPTACKEGAGGWKKKKEEGEEETEDGRGHGGTRGGRGDTGHWTLDWTLE
ncbi:hypothetical protein CSOJ01_10554 [Colletotrichum sojae]|uniref:Uncharacterized protein n=1 Tax=Colletotrichum sojae TaxID=2175907 RepID=A0A8H6MPW6_9PEZI|nr:hypothetical protein CSOJ01_10554 [Colletotrichum sojae]